MGQTAPHQNAAREPELPGKPYCRVGVTELFDDQAAVAEAPGVGRRLVVVEKASWGQAFQQVARRVVVHVEDGWPDPLRSG